MPPCVVSFNNFFRWRLNLFHIVLDNIDTRTSLDALRDLVTASNLYLRDRKPPNALLLHDVAAYVTKILTVFGTVSENDKIGFPVSTKTANNVPKMIFNKIVRCFIILFTG